MDITKLMRGMAGTLDVMNKTHWQRQTQSRGLINTREGETMQHRRKQSGRGRCNQHTDENTRAGSQDT